jgi:two-component system, LytTR family, sensor kinase
MGHWSIIMGIFNIDWYFWKMLSRNRKIWLVLGHVIFWAIPLSFFLGIVGPSQVREGKIEQGLQYILYTYGLYGLINIGIFYFNLFVIIPLSLHKSRYSLFVLLVVGLIAVAAIFKYYLALSYESFSLTVGPRQESVDKHSLGYIISTIIASGMMIFLSTVYQLVVDWLRNDSIQKELRNQNTQAELQFLKSQINPHFLFNTLNNIYALARKKSDEAPEALMKLSEIMRYMLQESNDSKTDLSTELQYLQNFIDLHRLRYREGVHINLHTQGLRGDERVMPMLFISFIENIFKHGLVQQAEKPVEIKIERVGNKLKYHSNNYLRTGNKDESSGIGMKNIYRRLELLYPASHFIKVEHGIDQYSITLELALT